MSVCPLVYSILFYSTHVIIHEYSCVYVCTLLPLLTFSCCLRVLAAASDDLVEEQTPRALTAGDTCNTPHATLSHHSPLTCSFIPSIHPHPPTRCWRAWTWSRPLKERALRAGRPRWRCAWRTAERSPWGRRSRLYQRPTSTSSAPAPVRPPGLGEVATGYWKFSGRLHCQD